jgi:hypothetical protein
MRIRTVPICCSTLLLLGLGVLAAADRTPAVASAWCATPPVADGADAEWPETTSVIPGTTVLWSVSNDAEHLYVRLRAEERPAQMQLLYGGLTVWIDPAGGEKRTLGIKYPVPTTLPAPGSRESRRRGPGSPGGGAQPPVHEPRSASGRRQPPPAPLDPLDVVPRRLELLGPDKDDVRSLVLDHVPGIGVGLARAEDALVYELKVPLAKTVTAPYSVNAGPGVTIGLGFETTKLERAKPPEGSGGAATSGSGGMGMGGIPMGMPGMGRGGPAGEDKPGLPKPWKVWTRVTLSPSPETPASR